MPLYDLAELNTHIVDLNRSDWDKERSDRKNGIYHFNSKVYVKTTDYDDRASRPQHILKFVDVDRLPEYRAKFGASPVTTDDPYWPEPMVPNAEGKYIYIDAILAKIPEMEAYIDFRQTERNKGHGGFADSVKDFQASAGEAKMTKRDKEELGIPG